MTVKAVLSRKGNNVITVEPTAPLSIAIDMLAKYRIGALVVTGTDSRVIGIVSERDVVHALAERGADALRQPLAEVMTRKVITCTERDKLVELMEQMTHGKFRHIPVVEQSRLIGIVSIGDVVKHRVEEMQRDTEALQDYIRTA